MKREKVPKSEFERRIYLRIRYIHSYSQDVNKVRLKLDSLCVCSKVCVLITYN